MTSRAYYFTTLLRWRHHAARFASSHWASADARTTQRDLQDSTAVLVVVEADEGAHVALEQAPGFTALPHPLNGKAVDPAVIAALGSYGVTPGADTFAVLEALGRIHPMLRHQVF